MSGESCREHLSVPGLFHLAQYLHLFHSVSASPSFSWLETIPSYIQVTFYCSIDPSGDTCVALAPDCWNGIVMDVAVFSSSPDEVGLLSHMLIHHLTS